MTDKLNFSTFVTDYKSFGYELFEVNFLNKFWFWYPDWFVPKITFDFVNTF